jgi:hypothetical protein
VIKGVVVKSATNLNLGNNSLFSLVVDVLASDPSPYGVGHTYYNSVSRGLRTWNGSAWYTVTGTDYVVGTIVVSSTGLLPNGFLECDGSFLDRTIYTTLFAVIGTVYGSSSSDDFQLPDLRGCFLRGWDHGAEVDPDAANRTNRGDGTTGDNVGTRQFYGMKSHYHQGVGSTLTNGSRHDSLCDYINIIGGVGNYRGGNETRPLNVNVLYGIRYT